MSSRRFGRGLLAAAVAGAAVAATLGVSVGQAGAATEQLSERQGAQSRVKAVPGTQVAALPSTAVAMGDSFISGEGAGAYQNVVDTGGASQGFPGWNAPNSNPFFCHRSANASISVADLPGIAQRVNIACSGGQPADVANDSAARESGRNVASQLAQLRQVAQSGDIDLVLVGLGSNNSQFTFGSVAAECAGRFVGDGFTGWWEVWIHLYNWVTGEAINENPCTDADLGTAQQFSAAQAETTTAVRQILDTLAEVDADGTHRVVLQDYINPLPQAYAERYRTEDGRNDRRDKYRALVRERYAAGCPAHEASLAPAHRFSAGLGSLVQGVASTLQAERPGADVVYLNVQSAFNGARLCEQDGSPGNALPTPLRVMDGPTGQHITDFGGYDKLDLKRIIDTCNQYFQTCQESWHPSAAGHQVLGQCLSRAWALGGSTRTCTRSSAGQINVQ